MQMYSKNQFSIMPLYDALPQYYNKAGIRIRRRVKRD